MKECEVRVYLGALTLAPTSTSPIVGATLVFLGIFSPGLILAFGFQALWGVIRSRSIVIAMIRGVRGRSGFHCGIYTLEDHWLSDSEPGERNEFRRRAMVGGHCCFNIHEYGMVWSGDVGGIVGGAISGLCWYGAVTPW